MLTLRKRGRFWHCRGTVRVGRKKQVVAEHSTGSREREAAEAYKAKLEYEIGQELLHGSAARRRQSSVAEALQVYLDRPGGLHRMDVWRIGELNDVLGDYDVADVAEGWRVFKTARCSGLAPATVERFRATLQAALNHAAADWGIDAPRLAKIKFQNARLRYLTSDERDRLLAAYPAHVRPIMLTLAYQGCRTQEALQLQWRDADLAAGRLFFPRTKNGEPRIVAIHSRVRAALGELAAARGPRREGHVFLNRLGRPYADTRDYKYPGGNPLRKAHETACKRARISDFRIHDWRHHWASWCVMSGIDFETIKRMGGWKSLRMVERYSAVSDDHMAAAIAKLA